MRTEAEQLLMELRTAFPERVPTGIVAPHECEECRSIRRALADKTWSEVPDAFTEEFCDSLPLLTPDAYHAYLPVWLRVALLDPDSEAAQMLIINLSDKPPVFSFNASQSRFIVAAVKYIANSNEFGANDSGNAEDVEAVNAIWGGHDA